jgi:hypothetical protein
LPGVARAFVRGRCRALLELPAIVRERRRLRPLRRVSWWRMWLAQRSFVVEYVRLTLAALRGRGSGLMQAKPEPRNTV